MEVTLHDSIKVSYRSMGTTGDPVRSASGTYTRIQKSQNEECWTLSPNPTNTHSAKHEL
jgi:hypothetical protein